MTHLRIREVDVHKGFLDPDAQGQLVDAIRKVAAQAPFFPARYPLWQADVGADDGGRAVRLVQ